MSPLDEQSKVHSGTKIVSDLMNDALENRRPFISKPYLAQTGNLMLLISSPIFDQDGHYKGLVDGTVYQHLHNYLVLLNNQIKRDGLTDLGNRRTFDCIMKEWFDNKLQYSIILIDIDHFKTVNDTYGHLVGDDVLRHLSSMMKKLSGEEDLCFRYGGEEFAILMTVQNDHDAFKIAERLRIKFSLDPNPTFSPITISLGISSYQREDQNYNEMIKRADSALYQSKINGRNRTTIYDE